MSEKILAPLIVAFLTTLVLPLVALAKPVCITRQELTARGPGIVVKFYLSSGQRVKKGDPIVELDSRLLRAGLKEAQGATDAARANEDLGQDAFERLEKLKNSEAVTEQQVAEARIRLIQAKAVRRQAEGAMERVKVQLEDTLIRADIAGIVQGLPSTLGMPVQVGQSLGRIEADPGSGSCKKPDSLKN